jgi:hypothetical protein
VNESYKFDLVQCNYDISNKEFLAITKCLKTWKHYLYGQTFEIVTDHQSLSHIPNQINLSFCQVQTIQLLIEYDYTVTYQSGSKNIVVDTLSRRANHQVNTIFTINQNKCFVKSFIPLYSKDPALSLLYDLAKKKPDKTHDFSILNNVLFRRGKIYVLEGKYSLITSMSVHTANKTNETV